MLPDTHPLFQAGRLWHCYVERSVRGFEMNSSSLFVGTTQSKTRATAEHPCLSHIYSSLPGHCTETTGRGKSPHGSVTCAILFRAHPLVPCSAHPQGVRLFSAFFGIPDSETLQWISIRSRTFWEDPTSLLPLLCRTC